ncbi:MAG: family 10 glycosylhydrolase, partial [Burkholderiales bacterium]|nr:family 10 glycosylhydrolase [Burkholderiales bacterium]
MTRRACLRALVAAAGAALAPGARAQASSASAAASPLADTPPPEPREFRGAWVASVANIDWPSRPGLAPDAQRAEALAIIERARTIGLNALILQVRPAGDALYPSTLEPWSEYLTGAQGRAPDPPWDPLAFWIAESHRRGLELHAWFNPYRARHSSARSPLAAPHFALRDPAAVKRYGDQLWMDPGEPAAQAQTLAVVSDVLRRYDVDGVHIDDYFYPYPVSVDGVEQPFPDDRSWSRYLLADGLLGREDWRRANVDAMVQALHRAVRALRPLARFGISPFGLGRPDRRPPGVSGFSQYDKLFADVERWFDEGWLDYLAPQLYWPIDRAGQNFPLLLDAWIAGNRKQRHLWPGLFTSSVRASAAEPVGPRAWPARELLDQIALVRSRPAASGHIHFSMAALRQDRDGIATLL